MAPDVIVEQRWRGACMPICADTVGISGPRLSQTPSTLYVPHSTLSSILHADQRHTGRGGHRRSRVFSIRAHRTCEPLHVWRHGTSPHESCTDRARIVQVLCTANMALSAHQYSKSGFWCPIHFAARFWRLGGIWGHSTTVSIIRDGCQRRPETRDRRWQRQMKRLLLAHEMQR